MRVGNCAIAAASGAVRVGNCAIATEVSLAMDAFLECVDAEPPSKEMLAAVTAWCKSNAIVNNSRSHLSSTVVKVAAMI